MGKQAWTKEQEEYIRNLYNSNDGNKIDKDLPKLTKKDECKYLY